MTTKIVNIGETKMKAFNKNGGYFSQKKVNATVF